MSQSRESKKKNRTPQAVAGRTPRIDRVFDRISSTPKKDFKTAHVAKRTRLIQDEAASNVSDDATHAQYEGPNLEFRRELWKCRGKTNNVKIQCKDRTVYAHSTVVSGEPGFFKTYFDDWRKMTAELEMDTFFEFGFLNSISLVVEQIIEFVYTDGIVENDWSSIHEILSFFDTENITMPDVESYCNTMLENALQLMDTDESIVKRICEYAANKKPSKKLSTTVKSLLADFSGCLQSSKYFHLLISESKFDDILRIVFFCQNTYPLMPLTTKTDTLRKASKPSNDLTICASDSSIYLPLKQVVTVGIFESGETSRHYAVNNSENETCLLMSQVEPTTLNEAVNSKIEDPSCKEASYPQPQTREVVLVEEVQRDEGLEEISDTKAETENVVTGILNQGADIHSESVNITDNKAYDNSMSPLERLELLHQYSDTKNGESVIRWKDMERDHKTNFNWFSCWWKREKIRLKEIQTTSVNVLNTSSSLSADQTLGVLQENII